MRKRLLQSVCICLVIVLTALLCACSNSSSKSEEGVLKEVKDESGAVTGYERRYHNDNGDLTRLDVYDANQEYDHYLIYEYDDSNRLIKETRYRSDGIGEYYYTYDYDNNGNLIEKGYFSAKDGAERTLYDSDGNETERYTYDSADTLTAHEVNRNGQWVAATEEASEEATE